MKQHFWGFSGPPKTTYNSVETFQAGKTGSPEKRMFWTERHVLLRQTIFNTFFGKWDARITSAKFCLIQVSLYCLSLYFLLNDFCSTKLLLSPKWTPFSTFLMYSWSLRPRDVLKLINFKRQFEFLLNQLWDLWSIARNVPSLMSKFYNKRRLYHCSRNTNELFQSAFINLRS